MASRGGSGSRDASWPGSRGYDRSWSGSGSREHSWSSGHDQNSRGSEVSQSSRVEESTQKEVSTTDHEGTPITKLTPSMLAFFNMFTERNWKCTLSAQELRAAGTPPTHLSLGGATPVHKGVFYVPPEGRRRFLAAMAKEVVANTTPQFFFHENSSDPGPLALEFDLKLTLADRQTAEAIYALLCREGLTDFSLLMTPLAHRYNLSRVAISSLHDSERAAVHAWLAANPEKLAPDAKRRVFGTEVPPEADARDGGLPDATQGGDVGRQTYQERVHMLERVLWEMLVNHKALYDDLVCLGAVAEERMPDAPAATKAEVEKMLSPDNAARAIAVASECRAQRWDRLRHQALELAKSLNVPSMVEQLNSQVQADNYESLCVLIEQCTARAFTGYKALVLDGVSTPRHALEMQRKRVEAMFEPRLTIFDVLRYIAGKQITEHANLPAALRNITGARPAAKPAAKPARGKKDVAVEQDPDNEDATLVSQGQYPTVPLANRLEVMNSVFKLLGMALAQVVQEKLAGFYQRDNPTVNLYAVVLQTQYGPNHNYSRTMAAAVAECIGDQNTKEHCEAMKYRLSSCHLVARSLDVKAGHKINCGLHVHVPYVIARRVDWLYVRESICVDLGKDNLRMDSSGPSALELWFQIIDAGPLTRNPGGLRMPYSFKAMRCPACERRAQADGCSVCGLTGTVRKVCCERSYQPLCVMNGTTPGPETGTGDVLAMLSGFIPSVVLAQCALSVPPGTPLTPGFDVGDNPPPSVHMAAKQELLDTEDVIKVTRSCLTTLRRRYGNDAAILTDSVRQVVLDMCDLGVNGVVIPVDNALTLTPELAAHGDMRYELIRQYVRELMPRFFHPEHFAGQVLPKAVEDMLARVSVSRVWIEWNGRVNMRIRATLEGFPRCFNRTAVNDPLLKALHPVDQRIYARSGADCMLLPGQHTSMTLTFVELTLEHGGKAVLRCGNNNMKKDGSRRVTVPCSAWHGVEIPLMPTELPPNDRDRQLFKARESARIRDLFFTREEQTDERAKEYIKTNHKAIMATMVTIARRTREISVAEAATFGPHPQFATFVQEYAQRSEAERVERLRARKEQGKT